MKRASGILFHITSISGKYGIGDFGEGVYKFIDFLESSKQKLWQILPLGVTGYGNSPYQSFSAFAGNPYFIDLDELREKGLLNDTDLKDLEDLNSEEKINYGEIYIKRYEALKKAYTNFKGTDEFLKLEKLKKENESWLEDYALYMSLKNRFSGISWEDWPMEYKTRDEEIISNAKIDLEDEINFYVFLEYFFRKQWKKIKEYANSKDIKIIGDIPIFVSTDSVDTWIKPQMFQFDENLVPKKVAGTPPDAFSDEGQLWGNVLYDWENMKKDGYLWWILRIKEYFKFYDVVRIDHFRGFESYYSIPAKDTTAINGRWEKGPGIELFNRIEEALGKLPIIAEDLGVLTDEVREMLKGSGFPGMKILQFAFDRREDNDYLPHFAPAKSVIYTGTHDNQTTRSWIASMDQETYEFTRGYLEKYLERDIEELRVEDFIESAFKSKSDIAIIPLQDILNLKDDTRMNAPATTEGNWSWRLKDLNILDKKVDYLKELTEKYER